MGMALALAAVGVLAQQDAAEQYLRAFEEARAAANRLRDPDEKDAAMSQAVASLGGGPADPRIRDKIIEVIREGTNRRNLAGPQTLRAAAEKLPRWPDSPETADAAILMTRSLLNTSLMARMNITLYEPAIVAALTALGQMHREVTRPKAGDIFPLLDPDVIHDHPPGVTKAAVEALQRIRVRESIEPLLGLMRQLQEDMCNFIQANGGSG